MRMPNLIIVSAIAMLIGGCTTTGQSGTQVAANFIHRQNVIPTTSETYPAKNPQTVAVYSKEHKPLTPYRIIGEATISKYNLLGMQRQENTLNKMMKSLAASMGGDGIMNVSMNNDHMKASIIQYQKIMI